MIKKATKVIVLLGCLCGSLYSYQTRNVFMYVIDGARYTETFGDTSAGHSRISRIWNQLRPQGTIFTNFFNNGGDTYTETCPGHSHILTGTWQAIPNDGTVRPTMPTVFEYFRKQTGCPDSANYVILGKNKLTILTYSTYTGYGAAYGALYKMPPANLQYRDTSAWNNVMGVFGATHPRLAIANMPQVDSCGHAGNWNNYIAAIRQADSLALELWNFFQSDPVYKDSTTLFIVNDHGRHTTDWTSHGDTCYGCRHVMCLMIGPDTKAGEVDSVMRQQIDIAPTIGLLLGFATPLAVGTPLPLTTAGVNKQRGSTQDKNQGLEVVFNSTSRTLSISYTITDKSMVTIKMFDMRGREVCPILHKEMLPGSYAMQWSTKTLPGGSYYCCLQSGRLKEAKKLVVIR